ncbi:hypothetical protein LPY66_02115 [Dehalobacter sp. DCM]|uniref:hypothetical protein n=1 Tax=Dehalobacter sp. DCM TaxID=2907827 RepID=UPI0030820C66|nr:hypothetical protein LPY66_02115 [Dehalobacter sp. DCM]
MKMGKKTFFLIFSVLFVVLFGCSVTDRQPASPDTQNEQSIADYMPLSEGNYWAYEGIGNEYASYTAKVTYQQDNKYQVMIDNGGSVTANRYEVTDSTLINTYRQSELYDDKNILNSPENYHAVLLQSPLTLGNSWESEGATYEIADTMATITVPAGTFENCLVVKIDYNDSGNTSYFYYKKGVGLIKTRYVMPGFDDIVSQLNTYSVRSNP